MICVIIAIKHGFLRKYICVGPQGALSARLWLKQYPQGSAYANAKKLCLTGILPKPLYKLVCVLLMFDVLIIMS